MEWQRKNEASIHRTVLNIQSRSIASLFKPLGCLLTTVKLSTANVDRLQQRWARQLLRKSVLLPRASTLKLASLPLASGASLSLAFYAWSPLPHHPLFVETPTQSGSRSPWWNGSARTKPASTELLKISRSRESVIAKENVVTRV